ncbi:MAG: elongation factor EF-2 [Candidatus Bathyarchaeota archaeon]|nr:elongation factor EF-2 [Candidatus Bathyarchaeota archaeon]MCX8177640.1 elongation factor EF-2 [Candidatus Bathyarchaeota archaeon]MDW8193896.1 elongation factor EF-2 [Nitrososphaerota archaeon]
MGRYRQVEDIIKLMNCTERIRNTSIIAHVDHGKTTLSDSLLAAAGIISEQVAGQKLFLDSWELEQKRQMTVFASNISLVHTYKGQDYLINLIDTPGHIDFSGNVTRSLRIVDGAVVVVDAVEGPMTQTETVLMQALRERVKPLLYINKVDRLIKELKLTPEEVQKRFAKIIVKVNNIIEKYAPPEHKKDWQVKVEDGRVAFGSALHKWGLNLPHMKAKGITFKDIIDAYSGPPEDIAQKVEALSKKAPLYEPILDMFCEHLPSPLEAQPYRQTQIWPGDPNSPVGKAMAKVDPNGPLLMCITFVEVDPHSGVVAIGRVFSGSVTKGKVVRLVTSRQKGAIQQVYMSMATDRVIVERIPAGNIAALSGLPSVHVGETIAEEGVETAPFEALKYVSDPVVTVAVEPENVKDLPLFDKVMHKITIEDPNLHFRIDKESGQYLLSGMGELHLEVTAYRMQEAGLKVKISKPIVIYRETISRDYKGSPILGKSPNKHNKLWVTIEKLPDEVIEAIKTGKINEMQSRDERQKILMKEYGWPTEDARNVIAIEGSNILVNRIKGRQYVEEVLDHIKSGFRDAVNTGILAKEPMYGLKVNLEDILVHEDPVHRGPAQILPMTWRPIWCAFLLSEPKLLEPIMSFECKVPNDFVSSVIALVQKRRGRILDMVNEEDMIIVKAEIPVAESFGIADELRSSTQGRAFWATQFSRWAPVPESMQADVIRQIRERKGMPPEPPKAEEFYEEE